MGLPKLTIKPEFWITRASHVVLTVADIARSRAFYVDTLGMVVSDEDKSTLYLRGLEEGCHHSLVLQQSDSPPRCERVGMRMMTEEDLDIGKAHFTAAGLAAEFVERPFQGRTLHVTDPVGSRLEFCASMTAVPRLILRPDLAHGASPQRLDHYQILTPTVGPACAFYMDLGFRLSEYVAVDGSFDLVGAFLQRKGNPHDIVFVEGRKLGFHHVAYTCPETHSLFQICDVAAARGYGGQVEFGPGRHFGPGYAQFVYLRDPDGHRIEFFNTHYQTMDLEDEPIRWDQGRMRSFPGWGVPAPDRWRFETTPFA